MRKILSCLSVLAMSGALFVGAYPANAALTSVGPPSAVHGLPLWYQDVTGLSLKPCLDNVTLSPAGGALCLMPPLFDPDPAVNPAPNAITTTGPIDATNFPDEVFYWVADAGADVTVTGGVGGAPAKLRLRMALEGNAALTPLAAPLTFMRINIQQMDGLAANGSYTVSTPYGDISFTADVDGTVKDANFNGQTFRNQIDATPPLFDAILPAIFPAIPPQQPVPITMDQLLVWDPAVLPVAPAGFIGDPNIPHTVVKSGDVVPVVVTFSGTGIATPVTITQFSLAGQIVGLVLTPPASTDFGAAKPGNPPPLAKTFGLTNLTALPVDPVIAAIVPGSNPATASPDFTIVPSAVTPCAPGLAAGASCNFDVVFNPAAGADGLRSATISATAGPTVPAALATVTGTSDATGPNVAIASPAQGSFTNINTPLLDFTATDPAGPVVNVVRLITVTPPASSVIPTVSGQNLALLDDGQYTVLVESTDAVGNPGTASATFTVDTVLPAVNVTAPAAGAVTLPTTPLTFTVDELNPSSTAVIVDGGTPLSTPPATLGPFTDGEHTVVVEVTDRAGNKNPQVLRTFTTDGTGPTVTISSPALTVASVIPNAIGVSNPVLTFTETDAHPETTPTPRVVKLDGQVIDPTNGLGPFLTPGVEQTLTIAATDILGNISTTTLPINLVLADGAMTTLGSQPASIGDVLLALSVSAKLETLDPASDTFKHGDVAPMVNSVPAPDQQIGIDDVMFILRKVAGLITF